MADVMFLNPLFYLCRITGFCLPFAFFSNAKTMPESLSKKPEPFFQLIPHLQCCKPINCLWPALGGTIFIFSSAVWTHLIIFSHWQAPYKILFYKIQKLKSIILNKCSSQIHTLPANSLSYQSAACRSYPRIHRQAPSPCHGIQYNLPS